MRFFKFISAFLLLAFLQSCNNDPYAVDTSKVHLKLEFVNLDSITFHASNKELLAFNNKYSKQHKEILDFSFGYCLGINTNQDTTFLRKIKDFKKDAYIQRLEKTISKLDKKGLEKELTDAFKRMKYHFPKGKVANSVYYINSLFSASVFCTEKEVAIGLDRYLGADAKVIRELPSQQFYGWIKDGMDKKFLTRDVLAAWLMTNYLEETTENYSSEMIRWGKILFITKALLPEIDEATVVRYHKKQYDWASKSEKSFWEFLVKKEMLFKTDEETRVNLLKEGPFSIGLPEESPDRMGQYMGFKIVQSYMESEEISLEELLDKSYNEILQKYEAK